MAEGLDNATITHRLVVTENAMHERVGNVFAKLGLAPPTATTAASSPSSPT